MIIDDDSPEVPDAEIPVDPSRFGSPRFARLVGSPTTRKLSPRRLAGASLCAMMISWGVYEGGVRISGWVSRWVASQPEHQIRFTEIDLRPSPPPYIRQGIAGILASVQRDGHHGETISVVGTDLAALRVDFRRNPWIESVGPVRASYRHLSVEVVYRRPLALVVFGEQTKLLAKVIDRNAVELPSEESQFAWAEQSPRYRAAGCAKPLVEIHDFGSGVAGRTGLVWQPTDPAVPEGKVVEAARLAEFLAQHGDETTARGRSFPSFKEIAYYPPRAKFFLRDERRNWVFWGASPGFEAAEEPKSAEKWSLLGQFLDVKGSLALTAREYLLLRPPQARVQPVEAAAAPRPTGPKGQLKK